MGAAKTLRQIMIDKKISITALAEQMGKPRSTVANTFQNDKLSVISANEYGEALGCDLLFKDKATGREYRVYVDD